MDRKTKVSTILRRLGKQYPLPITALRFRTPFQLLAATILSAQSTDVQVNKITGSLFKKYRGVKAFAEADPLELQADVSTVNFYRNKAKNIRQCAIIVQEKFGGLVPDTMEDLLTLPGVARKTANIVLSDAYGVLVGIAVDTHVKRLSGRLGISRHDDPVKIERDLMAATPKKRWADLSHLLILHGRAVCNARKPRHDECVLRDFCPSKNI